MITKPTGLRDKIFHTYHDACKAFESDQTAPTTGLRSCLEKQTTPKTGIKERHGKGATQLP
jgi:hypothetical protein